MTVWIHWSQNCMFTMPPNSKAMSLSMVLLYLKLQETRVTTRASHFRKDVFQFLLKELEKRAKEMT